MNRAKCASSRIRSATCLPRRRAGVFRQAIRSIHPQRCRSARPLTAAPSSQNISPPLLVVFLYPAGSRFDIGFGDCEDREEIEIVVGALNVGESVMAGNMVAPPARLLKTRQRTEYPRKVYKLCLRCATGTGRVVGRSVSGGRDADRTDASHQNTGEGQQQRGKSSQGIPGPKANGHAGHDQHGVNSHRQNHWLSRRFTFCLHPRRANSRRSSASARPAVRGAVVGTEISSSSAMGKSKLLSRSVRRPMRSRASSFRAKKPALSIHRDLTAAKASTRIYADSRGQNYGSTEGKSKPALTSITGQARKGIARLARPLTGEFSPFTAR